jgi:hypothetical protein
MGAVFRALLYLYPQRHRELLGAEMQAVFEQGAQEHRLLGPSQYLRFVLLELGGLLLHAAIAQMLPTGVTWKTRSTAPWPHHRIYLTR